MKNGEIEAIIWKHFTPHPERKAAFELLQNNVTEEDLQRVKAAGTCIPEHMFSKVWNALRDIERGI